MSKGKGLSPVGFSLTVSQEAHLSHIKAGFDRLVDTKYRKGAEEHTGDLRDNTILQLLDFAIDEAVDQVTYLFSMRSKICATMEVEIPEGTEQKEI